MDSEYEIGGGNLYYVLSFWPKSIMQGPISSGNDSRHVPLEDMRIWMGLCINLGLMSFCYFLLLNIIISLQKLYIWALKICIFSIEVVS